MFAPNLACVCIDEREEGRLYTYGTRQGMGFKNIYEMLKIMEEFFDEIDFPMKAMEYRSFKENKEEIKPSSTDKEQISYDFNILKNRGKIASFAVHVKYRQNCSWQGTIVWLENNKEEYFRSILEMVKLIESAIS